MYVTICIFFSILYVGTYIGRCIFIYIERETVERKVQGGGAEEVMVWAYGKQRFRISIVYQLVSFSLDLQMKVYAL